MGNIIYKKVSADFAEDFRVCLDAVAKESKNLLTLEAPEGESVQKFLKNNEENSYPQIFAFDGLVKVDLHVLMCNKPAIHLYKKVGFAEEGKIKKYRKLEGQYQDSLVMGLDLSEKFENKI